MRSVLSIAFSSACALLLLMPTLTSAQSSTPEPGFSSDTKFLRISEDAYGSPVALQSAITSYRSRDRSADGIQVDLVGALHIAEQSYFADLNRRFRAYDSVLYELIAPSDTRIPAGGPENPGTLTNVQGSITNALDLAFQLEEIDYNARNFVHADMSPEQVAESMASRNESLYAYFWKIFFFATREYARDPLGTKNADLLAALFAPDQQRALRIQFARELLEMDRVTESLEGPEGSTLISGRNEQALKIFDERLLAGDRHIAIFYGAGHLADFHKRLIRDYGLQFTGTEWVDAWDLSQQQE